MKAKAKVYIEFKGKRYTLTKGFLCRSKRDCSLFERGVCDCPEVSLEFPCQEIGSAFFKATDKWHRGGFKEVK